MSRHAEATFQSLQSQADKSLARSLFLRLVEPGTTPQDLTRRRARLDEFTLEDTISNSALRLVLNKFLNARLLTASEHYLEISHEALIDEWERLSDWINDARQDIKLQQTISRDALDWQANGFREEDLYVGRKLQDAIIWVKRNVASDIETHFITAAQNRDSEVHQWRNKYNAKLDVLIESFQRSTHTDEIIETLWEMLPELFDVDYLTYWDISDENSSELIVTRDNSQNDTVHATNIVAIDNPTAMLRSDLYVRDADLRSNGLIGDEIKSAVGFPFPDLGSLIIAGSSLSNSFLQTSVLNLVLSLSNHIANAFVKQYQLSSKDTVQKILTILNHEFRTPLTMIVAYSEMLGDVNLNEMDLEEANLLLGGVKSGANRLRRLIENFMCLVEIDSGEAAKTVAWRKRPVNVNRLLENVVNQIREDHARDIDLDIVVDSTIGEIVMDFQYMTIVVRELIDNAVKFSYDSHKVILNAKTFDEIFELTVADQARGIPTSEFPKIWEGFYQINREQFEDQGSGSGLAIVKGLVELHGGSVSVESEIDVGSTFTIRLPIEN